MTLMPTNYKRTRLACFTAYFTMSSVFSLPPLLFVTLRDMYGISYTLLGTLVLVNFCSQLLVDLLFTLLAKRFPVRTITKIMPLITTAGWLVYALVPAFFPQYAYAGLFAGTVIFSLSAGLSEVLLSPMIAAIPSDNPQRDMSTLHSLYAFGVFTVVVLSTLFFRIFGTENWIYLAIFMALLPIAAAALFAGAPMPDMDAAPAEKSRSSSRRRGLGLFLCAACIFFGSCAENTMSNWLSSYMENALHIDKTIGDVLGMAAFAILLGFTRIAYARYGKKITPVLLIGMIGAAACYLTAGLSTQIVPAFAACILTGMFTAMLWPGTLILMEERIPSAGVAAYALMAAAGDSGAAAAPQLLGIIVDKVSGSAFAANLGQSLSLTAEQVGMKAGMLISAAFPLLGICVMLAIIRYSRKEA